MRKSVTKIVKATVAFAMAIGAGVGAALSNGKEATRVSADDLTYTIGWGTASGDPGTYSNFEAVSGSVPGVLSFTSAKNSSGTNPAYNSSNNELRLYYHNGGAGGSITLTPATGVTFTGFVMTTSTSPSVKYSVDGGSATSVSVSNNTYTVTGLEASSSLKIQNVNTTNTQLRIKTIELTYISSGATQVYSVTYDDNGSTSGTVPTDSNEYTSGQSVTVLGNSGSLQKTDYYWSGWNTASDGSGTNYVENNTFNISDNVTLYAKWAVVKHNPTDDGSKVTWDLSKATYETMTASSATWESSKATISIDKGGSSTATNNYCPPEKTSTRFYKNSVLTVTPADGYQINSIVFEATTEDYASALKNSSWTNAISNITTTTVTITPTDKKSLVSATIGDTTGCTSVVINYAVATDDPSASLSVGSVEIKTNQDDGVTVTVLTDNIVNPSFVWSTANANITLENTTSATVTIKPDTDDAGSATVTVRVDGTNGGNPIETIVLNVTVTINEPGQGETQGTAFTVAQARAHIDEVIDAGTSTGNDGNYYFATGIVSRLYSQSVNGSGQISYYISDDGTTNEELEAYNGKGLNGASFTSIDEIEVGDTVIIYGLLKKHNTTYEFDYNNYIVSQTKAPKVNSITLTPSAITVEPSESGDIADLFTSILINQDDGSNKTINDIVWTSGDDNIFCVIGDEYIAGNEHRSSTTLHASIGGKEYGSATITIIDPSIHSISYSTIDLSKVNSIQIGDEIVFVYENGNVKKELTSITTMGVVSDYNQEPNCGYLLTVVAGSANDSVAFKTNNNHYLSWDSGNTLSTSEEVNDASSWTITNNNGNFKFANVGTTDRLLQYNSGSPRFACYTSSQSAFQVYKRSENVNYVDLTTFAETKTAYEDENESYVRLGVTLAEEDWAAMDTAFGIAGYGVMLLREATLESAGFSSIEEVYRSESLSKPNLKDLRKTSDVAPADFSVVARINITNNSNRAVVFCAATYVVSDSGDIIFINEARGSLVDLLP